MLYNGCDVSDHDVQWNNLSDKLRENRLTHMQALMQKQAKERSMYAKKIETSSSTADIVKVTGRSRMGQVLLRK